MLLYIILVGSITADISHSLHYSKIYLHLTNIVGGVEQRQPLCMHVCACGLASLCSIFSEFEFELYLLRKEPELELAELDELLELAPPQESVPLLELATGIQWGHSN